MELREMHIYIAFNETWVCEDVDRMNDFHNCKIYGIEFCPYCGVKLE